MTGLVRKTMLLGVCGLLAAATAFANVPSPANSTIEWPGDPNGPGTANFIPVCGTQGGLPHGQVVAVPPPTDMMIRITVRDFGNNPIGGSAVEVDFGGCIDIALCSAVVVGGGTVDCGGVPNGRVIGTTNASGQFDVYIIGAATNDLGDEVGSAADCVEVRADGVVIGNATAFTLDQNGGEPPYTGNGHNGLDSFLASVDVNHYALTTEYRGRAAYNTADDHSLSGLDVFFQNLWIGESALSKGSFEGCPGASYCP